MSGKITHELKVDDQLLVVSATKLKECRGCGRTKPLSDFYISPTSSDGHEGKCKKCRQLRKEQIRRKHKQEAALAEMKAQEAEKNGLVEKEAVQPATWQGLSADKLIIDDTKTMKSLNNRIVGPPRGQAWNAHMFPQALVDRAVEVTVPDGEYALIWLGDNLFHLRDKNGVVRAVHLATGDGQIPITGSAVQPGLPEMPPDPMRRKQGDILAAVQLLLEMSQYDRSTVIRMVEAYDKEPI